MVEGGVGERGDADVEVRHRLQQPAEGHLGAELVALAAQWQTQADGDDAQLGVPVEQPLQHLDDSQQRQVALVLGARHPADDDTRVGRFHAEARQLAVEAVLDHRHVLGPRRAVLLRKHLAGRRRQVGDPGEPQDFGEPFCVGGPHPPTRFQPARRALRHVRRAEVVVVVEAHRHAALHQLLQVARAVQAAKAVHEVAARQRPQRQIAFQLGRPQHLVTPPLQRAHREDRAVVGVGGAWLDDEAQSHRPSLRPACKSAKRFPALSPTGSGLAVALNELTGAGSSRAGAATRTPRRTGVAEPITFESSLHLGWKWNGTKEQLAQGALGQTPHMIFTHSELGENEIKNSEEFVEIKLSNCGLLNGGQKVTGYESAMPTPSGLEGFSKEPAWTFTAGKHRQHYWNGKENVGIETQLKTKGFESTFEGKTTEHVYTPTGQEQEVAIFEN